MNPLPRKSHRRHLISPASNCDNTSTVLSTRGAHWQLSPCFSLGVGHIGTLSLACTKTQKIQTSRRKASTQHKAFTTVSHSNQLGYGGNALSKSVNLGDSQRSTSHTGLLKDGSLRPTVLHFSPHLPITVSDLHPHCHLTQKWTKLLWPQTQL